MKLNDVLSVNLMIFSLALIKQSSLFKRSFTIKIDHREEIYFSPKIIASLTLSYSSISIPKKPSLFVTSSILNKILTLKLCM